MNLTRSLIVISWSNTHFISLSPFLSHFFCSLKSLCFFLSFPLCTFCLILQSELHYIAISCFLFNVFHVWLLPKQIFANFCNFRATRNRQICCFFFLALNQENLQGKHDAANWSLEPVRRHQQQKQQQQKQQQLQANKPSTEKIFGKKREAGNMRL